MRDYSEPTGFGLLLTPGLYRRDGIESNGLFREVNSIDAFDAGRTAYICKSRKNLIEAVELGAIILSMPAQMIGLEKQSTKLFRYISNFRRENSENLDQVLQFQKAKSFKLGYRYEKARARGKVVFGLIMLDLAGLMYEHYTH